MSDVSSETYDLNGSRFVDVRATGGTRRERGSATGALIRKLPGTWIRYHTSYSETSGFLTATYTKYRCDKPVSFEAHTGRPSWHQARAGAISAGIVRFGTKAEADEYVANHKVRYPSEPAFVITKD
jgi:hypothetical protein